jgi:hypothetical protein
LSGQKQGQGNGGSSGLFKKCGKAPQVLKIPKNGANVTPRDADTFDVGKHCRCVRPTAPHWGKRRGNVLFVKERDSMQVKVYIPKIIEIPSEYLPALAKRAADCLGERAGEVSATRGHLVRQAVQDGLLREFDPLIGQDGTVDLVCDPGMEIPLELENKTLSLSELLEALQYRRTWAEVKSASEAA